MPKRRSNSNMASAEVSTGIASNTMQATMNGWSTSTVRKKVIPGARILMTVMYFIFTGRNERIQ